MPPSCDYTVTFHQKPYRHYQIHRNGQTRKVASVTQVLGVLDKSDALVGWATNLTCEGIHKLVRRRGYEIPGHWRQLQGDLRAAGLDHKSATGEAALRGTTIHKMFEDWVNERKIPNANEHPEAWRGYIRALASWLMAMTDAGADFEVAEVIVGSARHGFAGTCDTVAVTQGKDGQRVRWDLKTSRQVYARSHFRQLAAYELASVEMGYEPTDKQAIVVLRGDGTHDVGWSFATAQDFLNVLQVWRDEQPFKQAENAAYKARREHEKQMRAKGASS